MLSPFMGVGSEGYCSLRRGRRKFIGVELKKSYFDVAISNLNRGVSEQTQGNLF